jgi:hypothetical protein
MVARYADTFEPAQYIDTAMRIRAISHDITEQPEFIGPAAAVHVFKDSHQGSSVGMYVGKYRASHVVNIISQTMTAGSSQRTAVSFQHAAN